MQLNLQAYITKRIVVDDENSCWLWQRTLDRDGYGRGSFQKRRAGAHRLSYEAFREPIPEGMQPDHLCRVRRCVNPWHLELVTPAENTRRGVRADQTKTHCKRGHSYAEHGRRDTKGRNQCRECDRLRARASYEKHRDTVTAHQRDYYAKNREKIIARQLAKYHEGKT